MTSKLRHDGSQTVFPGGGVRARAEWYVKTYATLCSIYYEGAEIEAHSLDELADKIEAKMRETKPRGAK